MNSIFPKKPVFDINYKLLNNIFPTISIEKKIFKLIYKSLENNIKNIHINFRTISTGSNPSNNTLFLYC